MNKTLTLLCGLSLWCVTTQVLVSCEKPIFEEEPKETTVNKSKNGKENVILRVTEFRQIPFDDLSASAPSFTRSLTDLASYCSRLNFVIYKDGKKIDSKSQMKDDNGFGEIAFSLQPDTYKLLVLAHSSVGGTPTLTDPEKIQFTNAIGFSDTFSYYGNLEVTTDQNHHDIILTRNVSCVRFIVKDDFPSDVKYMRFNYTGGSGVLNAVTGFGGNVNSQQEKSVDISKFSTPITFNLYTFLQEEEAFLQLTVSALKADKSTVVMKRVFEKIPMKHRMVTEYSGCFFDSDHTFGLLADTDWGDPYYKEEY